MKRSQQLAQSEATKRARVQEILAKSDATDAEHQEADTLIGEIKGIQADRVKAEEREAFGEENETELKKLSDEPALGGIPHPGQKAGQGRLAGFEDAGTTVVDKKDLSVVYEEGFLGLDQKTMAAISSTSYKRAYRNYLRKGIAELGSTERKTLQEGVDSQGGYLVPEDLQSRIITRKPAPMRLAARVTRLQTSRDRLVMPKNNYSADDVYSTGVRLAWTGEKTQATEHRADDPKFGQVAIDVHTAMLSLLITQDMIEDSAFPIVGWCTEKFQETVAIAYDDMIVNGSGLGQPEGILFNPGGAGAPEVVKSGDANNYTPDGLVDITYSLPEQYDENACFIFNKTSSGRAIAKLKDADNRYLFSTGMDNSGIASARPKDLLGYDYLYSALMPIVGANKFPLIFGDPTGYFQVTRVGFSIQVLKEKYAEDNQIALVGRVRFGGKVAEDFKLKVQKIAA